MAERRSRQEKIKEDWFFDLSPKSKLMYYYLNDSVDRAGFYPVSIKHIMFETKLSNHEIEHCFSELEQAGIIIRSDDNKTMWLTTFLKEQNNYPLKSNNNCHKGVCAVMCKTIYFFNSHIDLFEKIKIFKVSIDRKTKEEIVEEFGLVTYLKREGLM